MVSRRVIALVAAFALVGSTAAFAQQSQKQQDPKKRSKQEQLEIEQMVKLVDSVMAGQPGPSDVQLTLTPYFLKSQEQRTFVPFALSVANAPAADAVLYIRVVNPQAAAADPKEKKKIEYPWEDIHFVPAAQFSAGTARLHRVFMTPPGTYDVYVGFRERVGEKAPKNQTPKTSVVKTQVTVPDFWNGQLATSSILVTDRINSLTAQITPDEARERPFVFGTQELVPTSDLEFKKSEELSVFFQVYNAGVDAAGKPNLLLEYNFHKKEGEAEKFFNKTNPQTVDASNLPAAFDPSKFPVPGGITVPLTTFPEGEYRLEIKISDKAGGKTETRDVKFTVKG